MPDAPVIIVPDETPLTEPFWQAARRHQLYLQRCDTCSAVVHPPQPCCPNCPGEPMRWFVASGTGAVEGATVVYHATHPAVTGAVPYTVLLVRLIEGPLMVSKPASGVEPPEVGMAVHVAFEQLPGTDFVLPTFAATELPQPRKD